MHSRRNDNGKRVGSIPSTSLEQLGLEAVKLGVPSVWSVWVGVDSDKLRGGELRTLPPGYRRLGVISSSDWYVASVIISDLKKTIKLQYIKHKCLNIILWENRRY